MCVCVFIYFINVSMFTLTHLLRTILVYYVYDLFYFDIVLTHFVKKMRTQNTENSEKENSETKQEIRTKREVNEDKTKL